MTNEEPRKIGVYCWWEDTDDGDILHIERVRRDGSVVPFECTRGEAAAVQLFFALP